MSACIRDFITSRGYTDAQLRHPAQEAAAILVVIVYTLSKVFGSNTLFTSSYTHRYTPRPIDSITNIDPNPR